MKKSREGAIQDGLRESGVFPKSSKTPERVAAERESKAFETSAERKERMLGRFDAILGFNDSPILRKVKEVGHGFNLIQLEVFVYRFIEAGERFNSSYAEIAARLQNVYGQDKISEQVVRLVANGIREAFWNALDKPEQEALSAEKYSTHKLPKRIVNFILGNETD